MWAWSSANRTGGYKKTKENEGGEERIYRGAGFDLDKVALGSSRGECAGIGFSFLTRTLHLSHTDLGDAGKMTRLRAASMSDYQTAVPAIAIDRAGFSACRIQCAEHDPKLWDFRWAPSSGSPYRDMRIVKWRLYRA